MRWDVSEPLDVGGFVGGIAIHGKLPSYQTLMKVDQLGAIAENVS